MMGLKFTHYVRPRLKHFAVIINLSLGLSSIPLSAHALMCGETVGPKEKVVLDSDVGPCDAQNGGGITIIGPATLDMNDFVLSCINLGNPNDVPNGITIEGKGAKVRNGSVENCDKGVVVAGEGKHRLEKLTAKGSADTGFDIQSDGNTLKENNAEDNGDVGFDVTGNKNRLSQNMATHHDSGFSLSGVQNRLTSNTASINDVGFFVASGRNKLMRNEAIANASHGFLETEVERNNFTRNSAIANGGDGFIFESTKSAYVKNTATSNDGSGFFGLAEKLRLNANQADQNGEAGIRLFPGSNAFLTKNTANNNDTANVGAFDLEDESLDCGANRWRHNEFGTANQACIQ